MKPVNTICSGPTKSHLGGALAVDFTDFGTP